MKKIGVFIILYYLIGCTACSGSIQKEAAHKSRIEPDKTNIGVISADQEKTLDDYIEVATLGCKVAKEHENVEQGYALEKGRITYRVDNVKVTKQQGDWVDLSAGPELDGHGKIIDNHTYIVVDVTVRQDGELDFWWNFFGLSSFEEDNLHIWPTEMVSAGILCQDGNVGLTAKNVYQYSLPEGKDVKTSLIFAVEDRLLDEEGRHFLLELNPSGTVHENLKPEDYSMVFLESMEDRKANSK